MLIGAWLTSFVNFTTIQSMLKLSCNAKYSLALYIPAFVSLLWIASNSVRANIVKTVSDLVNQESESDGGVTLIRLDLPSTSSLFDGSFPDPILREGRWKSSLLDTTWDNVVSLSGEDEDSTEGWLLMENAKRGS